MAMTNAQLEALLNNQTTQVNKIAKEQSDRYDAAVATNKRLQELIDAGGEITPATQKAAEDHQAALDNLDAAIPDAPVPPAPPA